MRREYYSDEDWGFLLKESLTFSSIDFRLKQIERLQSEINSLCSRLGEWVIRRRWIRDVSTTWGIVSQGHTLYYRHNTEHGPGGFTAIKPDQAGVAKFKSPRDAEFILETLHNNRKRKRGVDYVDEIVRVS